ncbi:MAG: MFS transporter [Gammaproteobacteria bacterium]|jgi:AAA family ATP:ADP antiporter|nr:MFS transporter [Gammaproteobacteria bacterium]NDF85196.1 MFS transporter [Gammaproteobacteria bacterium]
MRAESTALQRLLARFARVEPRETAAVVAAFCLFFFVLGSYFAVRPVRETVATLLGRDRVADLWLYTALFSIAIVPLWGWLVARLRRSLLLPMLYGVVAVILAFIGSSIQVDESNLQVGTFFYVWISVINLMLVSVFWSFLLEMFSAEQSKRLFGFIAAGGTFGALVGPLTARLLVDSIGNSGVLYLGTTGFLGAIVCQRVLIGIWNRKREADAAVSAEASNESQGDDAGLGGNPFAGIFIVLRSPYLLGIASFVVLLSAVNTFLYFEQLRIVSETFEDTTRRTEVFANIDFIVQSLTILSQLFLTGRIASRLGVRTLLTFVPVIMFFGFVVLSMLNVFFMIAALLILRRWGEYAFIRPGREMLWGSLDTESKYKAKSFVDVPVYRAADYVGAQAKSALDAVGASPAGAALIGAALAAAWAVNGWTLGRKHDVASAREPRE